MLNLSGIIDNQSILVVHEMTKTAFVDYTIFKTPESLILYEQGYISNEKLLELCNEEYKDLILQEPKASYVPKSIIELFRNSNSVPIMCNTLKKIIKVIYIPEYNFTDVNVNNYTIEMIPTTLHYFILNHTRVFGNFKEILPITGKEALTMIIEEAIKRKVPDLTISNEEELVIVYYNQNKRKVMATNIFPRYIMDDILKVLTISTPMDTSINSAKYVGYEIDEDYRARVVINKTYYGHAITIRLLPNAMFENTLESININQEVIKHFRDKEVSMLNGIRFVVGETLSGKNTTVLAILKEIVEQGTCKVVSIEMPVEQKIKGVEQIQCETLKEYISNIESLIHQNPDFIYVTETKDSTGSAVMKVANTGKRLFTTLHSNSCADTISRITDITGLPINRVIQVLHTIVHQKLVNVGSKLKPYTTFVYFDNELKQNLYDKPFGEVIRLIQESEKGGFSYE